MKREVQERLTKQANRPFVSDTPHCYSSAALLKQRELISASPALIIRKFLTSSSSASYGLVSLYQINHVPRPIDDAGLMFHT